MNTSETYIKMCGKAVEIQKDHNFREADFLAGYDEDGQFYIGTFCNEYNWYGKWTWLPRQDQLQDMIVSQDLANYPVVRPNELPLIDNLLTAFESFYNKQIWMGKADNIDKRPSMEQLWLCFIMKEKFNKVWNGEDWILS